MGFCDRLEELLGRVFSPAFRRVGGGAGAFLGVAMSSSGTMVWVGCCEGERHFSGTLGGATSYESAGGGGSGLFRSLEDLGVDGLRMPVRALTGGVLGPDDWKPSGMDWSKSAKDTVCGPRILGLGGAGGAKSSDLPSCPMRPDFSSSSLSDADS